MDPFDPLDAQQVVVEYARVLEQHLEAQAHPARLDSLPYSKPLIKSAIETSARSLSRSGQLTDELCEYLETAYIYLAEYLDAELVELMRDYRKSADALSAGIRPPAEKTQTVAWRRVAETGALAGEVARFVTNETEKLRREFRSFVVSA